MRLGCLLVGTATVAVVFTPSVVATASVSDPPRLVRWHLIGNIGIGMTTTRIEYTYGFPIDRSSDNHFDFRLYRGRGRIGVAYDDRGRAVWVSTDSPMYTTADDFGVGTAIPLGKCHPISGKCAYRWKGFTLEYGEGGTHVWVGTFSGFHVMDPASATVTTRVAQHLTHHH